MNLLKFPLFHLYLLQLENFDLTRFWRIITNRGLLWYIKPRKSITWTAKIKTAFIFALILHGGLSVAITLVFRNTANQITAALILFICSLGGFIFYPVFLSFAVVGILPVDLFIKQLVITRAILKIKQFPQLKIVGIAGSYGKTTTKEFIASVLSQKYKVLKTPENINTPLGIARLILKYLTDETQVFVVEMGEFYKGDIAGICKIVKPNLAVVTGINEAHLERLHTLKETSDTIFEVVTNSRNDAPVVLNADDQNILYQYKTYCDSKQILFFGSYNQERLKYKIQKVRYLPDGVGISYSLTNLTSAEKVNITTQLLGNYAIGSSMCSIVVGEILRVSASDASTAISHVTPIVHRLQPLPNKNHVLIIDDTYNGNSSGVKEAIDVLSRFTKRRKVYITPGLVETGVQSQVVHEMIGRQLAHVADLVLLVQNSVTPEIEAGLIDEGFPGKNIVYFPDAQTLFSNFSKYIKPNDVVLLQNDWPENYI